MDSDLIDEQLAHAAAALPAAAPTELASIERRARARRQRRIAGQALGVAASVAIAFMVVPAVVDTPGRSGLEIVGGPAEVEPGEPGPVEPEPAESGWPQVRGSTLEFPLDGVAAGVSPGTIEDRRVFFVRDGDDVEVFLAAAQHLPNEGLWWCPAEQVFASPFHGEVFDPDGRARLGPAHRDLDRFVTEVRDDVVSVDAGRVIPGARVQRGEDGSVNARGNDGGAVLSDEDQRAYGQPWDEGFCTDHRPDTDPPQVLAPGIGAAPAPDGAEPIDAQEVPPQLRERFLLDDGEPVVAITVPGGQDRPVFATPDTDPPLMFAADCDLLGASELPVGWLGLCLDRLDPGQPEPAVYPYGTSP